MKIKNIFLGILFGTSLILSSCEKDLEVTNKNEPTPDALKTENGLLSACAGVYANMYFQDGGNGDYDFYWVTLTTHELMGDGIFCPYGNFSWRWANQTSSITLDNGTKVTPPAEGDQALSLKARNARAEIDNNCFAHEWISMYAVNGTCNLILEALDKGGISVSGNAEVKLATVRAWAYWWKGYVYSRVGSMYVAGVAVDKYGQTSSPYLSHADMIIEANANFDKAIEILNGLSDDEDYKTVLKNAIPSHFQPNGTPSPQEWIRNINTMKARNLLVNTKDKVKTAADWNAIKALADKGLQSGDFEFVFTADGNNFMDSGWLPARLLLSWAFASERLVQDFKAGDDRFTRNFELLESPIVNMRGRGIQFGTRYGYVEGDYASSAYAKLFARIGASYEENVLMQSEALINTNQIEEGLALIDAVRDYQKSGLAHVAGNSLTMAAAKDELRRERRIGLHLRGVTFYDARRWGVIDPVAEGGGRSGAVVLDAAGTVNTNATIDYKYMDYFDVPANETDFNIPQEGAPAVTEDAK